MSYPADARARGIIRSRASERWFAKLYERGQSGNFGEWRVKEKSVSIRKLSALFFIVRDKRGKGKRGNVSHGLQNDWIRVL